MKNQFEMYMLGEISFFLGLKISQYDKGIFISQTKYIKDMLNMFRIEYCTLVETPMVTGCKLRKNDEYMEENQILCTSMIRSVLYMMTSRP